MSESKAKCPTCQKIIDFRKRQKIRELVTCPHCKNLLEVVQEFPQRLDWAEDPQVFSFRSRHQKYY